LGEGNLWHKFTNYEHSVRVPLIVKVPWMTGLAGTIVSVPVELIDIYPTMAALTKSGPLANASALDGVDFSPVLLSTIRRSRSRSDAIQSAGSPIDAIQTGGNDGAAGVSEDAPCSQRVKTFSDFPRCGEKELGPQSTWPTGAYEKNYCKSSPVSGIFAMGYSLRSADYRYTRWMRWNGTVSSQASTCCVIDMRVIYVSSLTDCLWVQTLAVLPDGWLDDSSATPSLLGEELYDHTGDDGTNFDKFPLGHKNLAGEASAASQLKEHRGTLAAFFRDGDESVAFAPGCGV
jgi:hypothetical protein